MDLSFGPDYEEFRRQVRRFFEEAWTDEDRASGPDPNAPESMLRGARTDPRATAFRAKAIARGYLYRHVPRRYGGSEEPADPLKSVVLAEEYRRAAAPGEVVGQGASMLVPTLLEHGTEEQKQRFIRDTLLGRILWCQGYSEPGAGSDLAALRTKAELVGDHWIVNGHKIWTSNADTASWMFALVRTEPDAPKHQGITYLLIDMKTPGITVRPLRQMTGDADFNEVFFDNVKVPAKNVVGKRGEGWLVSRSTLKHERALIGGAGVHRRTFDGLSMLARAVELRGRPAAEDPLIRARLVEVETKLRALELHGFRLLTIEHRKEEPGLAGLVSKLYGTQLNYEIGRLAMDVLGDRGALAPGEGGAPAAGMFVTAYMWTLGMLIAGGAANIQRNIIAERGFGLPRDPTANAVGPTSRSGRVEDPRR